MLLCVIFAESRVVTVSISSISGNGEASSVAIARTSTGASKCGSVARDALVVASRVGFGKRERRGEACEVLCVARGS